jgi:hypothetical protein
VIAAGGQFSTALGVEAASSTAEFSQRRPANPRRGNSKRASVPSTWFVTPLQKDSCTVLFHFICTYVPRGLLLTYEAQEDKGLSSQL